MLSPVSQVLGLLKQTVTVGFPSANQAPSSTVAEIVQSAVTESGELEEATAEVEGIAVVACALAAMSDRF